MEEKKVTYKELDKYLSNRDYFGMYPDKKFVRSQLEDPYLTGITFESIAREGWAVYLAKLLKWGDQWEQMQAQKRAEKDSATTLFNWMGKGDAEGDDRCSLIESDDGMELKLILHKPLPGERSMTENDIWKCLIKRKVTYGVKDSYIRRLVERPIYEKRFKIARGESPGVGEDGKVIYHFDREFSMAPKVGENGKADYKSLDYIKTVNKGDLLCEIIPPTCGPEGRGLDGSILPGIEGRSVHVSAGMNTLLSADKRGIYASCDGFPMEEDGVVYVCKYLRLDNVSGATGHIDFIGSVHVAGDVEEGFTVSATDDIIVDGIVEGSIEAGRNVILRNGMKGSEKQTLIVGKDLRAEFIENTEVLVKGNIYADVIMNSKVECWENIMVFGKRGKLVGGEYWAGSKIEADEIGNQANVYTSLRLFPSAGEERKRKNFTMRIKTATNFINELTKVLESKKGREDVSWKIVVVRVAYMIKYLEKCVEEWQEHLTKMQEWNMSNREVISMEILHPNVYVELNNVPFRNRHDRNGRTSIRAIRGFIDVITEGEMN